MRNCWVGLWSEDRRELKTIPVADHRSRASLQFRGWVVVRIFRANLPWPADQPLASCMTGHR